MTGREKILLVEDDPNDAALTVRALQKHAAGSEIAVVRDGLEALDYLFGTGTFTGRSLELQPRVVLLDLNLPRMEGLEFLRRLRADARTRLIPVVILTSSRDSLDIQRGYGLGANSYVRKPVDFQQFSDAARELSVYWLVLNEPPVPGAA